MRKKQLRWHHRRLGITKVWDEGVTGKGARVAILDSGLARVSDIVRPSTEYLDDRGNKIGAADQGGHGTSCASLIASRRDGALGIAPDALLSSYRVLDSGNLAAKIERALAAIVKRDDIDVVLCAFVIEAITPGIAESVRLLATRGTVVVASAGNRASTASEFPELTPHALTVAGTTENDAPLPNARRGIWIDVAAPGQALRALTPQNNEFDFGDTSGAAALVAGIAALMISSQSGATKRAKVGQLFECMARASATALPGAPANSVGKGLINPAAILKLIQQGV